MGAITQKYKLKQVLELSINAGNDILLFGNQLNPSNVVSTKKLVDTIVELVEKDKRIKIGTIETSYKHIQTLKEKL